MVDKHDSLADRNELFFAAATIAAHGQQRPDGFRQSDVKFFIELFSNWVESSLHHRTLSIKNTQVKRYLEYLTTEGCARKLHRSSRPTYLLTRSGLITLLSRLVNRIYIDKKEQFFFLYFFIKNYKRPLNKMVEQGGSQYPFAFKVELENLLDADQLKKRELKAAETELNKLNNRIRENIETDRLIKHLYANDKTEMEILKEIQKNYPYALNSQKPLLEVMAMFPKEVLKYELKAGYARRVEDIYKPQAKILQAYIDTLKSLK